MKAYLRFSLIVSIIFSFSCSKEVYDFDKFSTNESFTPNIGLPGVKSALSMNDLLNEDTEQYLYIDNDNLLHLKYTANLDTLRISDFVDSIPVQDTVCDFLAVIDYSVPDFNNGMDITSTKSIDFKLKTEDSDQKIDSFRVDSGYFDLNVSSNFVFDGSMTVSFPEIKKNGQTLKIEVPYTNVLSKNESILVTDFMVNSTHEGNPNSVGSDYELKMKRTTDNIDASSFVKGTLTTKSVKVSEIYGYFGQDTVEFPVDTIPIEISERILDGDIYIADITVDLSLKNSFGLPLNLNHGGLIASYEDQSSDVVTGLDNPLSILSPSFSQMGQTKETHVIIDNTSNLPDVIQKYPTSFTIGGNLITNPLGIGNNFILESNSLISNIEVDIPFDFELANFYLRDTMDYNFDLSSDSSTMTIDSSSIFIYFTNGFPIEFDVQLYFADENYKILDSVFYPNRMIVNCGKIVEGKIDQVTGVSKELVTLKFDKNRSNKFKNAKYILVAAKIETSDAKPSGPHNPVKIYADYSLGVELNITASAKIKID